MAKFSCIIIEDEPLALERTKNYVEQIPFLQLSATFDNAIKGLAYLVAHQVDILFLDINMDELTGVELLESAKIKSQVIITTAYQEYALKGYELNVTDYLLKPFDQLQIAATLNKYKSMLRPIHEDYFDAEKLLNYFGVQATTPQTNILVYQGERIVPVKITQLALIYKKHNITYLLTFDRQQYSIEENLNQLEPQLGPDFFRVNRQFIVHREAVKEAVRFLGRKLIIRLNFSFQEQIIISKARAPIFLKWLENY